MSDFGDSEPDDAFDTEPADPVQVARKQHDLRRAEGFDDGYDWDELTDEQRQRLVLLAGRLLIWLRRQGALP